MNLVFFDIECAVVTKTLAKICAFGYVLCDEKFNILKQEDLLINPHGGFHLTDRKGDKGLVLPYDYSSFKSKPDFRKVYPVIKSLLEDKNNLVLGHAVLNDVKYLDLESRRFNLPPFEFSFSDSQLIFMTYINDFSKQPGLEHIAGALGVDFTPHRAVDDAYATMRIVEAMCKKEGCGYPELVKKLCITEGCIKNHEIKKPASTGKRRYDAARSELKKKRAEFCAVISGKYPSPKGRLKDKVFTFSREIEDDFPRSGELAKRIFRLGGRYTTHVTHCTVFVLKEGDQTPRAKYAESSEKIKVISQTELEKLLYD